MTIEASMLFVVVMASLTLAARWVVHKRRWHVAAFGVAVLVALIALHDATLATLSLRQAAQDQAQAQARARPWSAHDIYAWLAQDPADAVEDRGRQVGAAIAKARDDAAWEADAREMRVSSRQLCVGNELAGVLAVAISDARSAMLEDLVSGPCRVPGLLASRKR